MPARSGLPACRSAVALVVRAGFVAITVAFVPRIAKFRDAPQECSSLDNPDEPAYCHRPNFGQPMTPKDLPQSLPALQLMKPGVAVRFGAAIALARLEGECQVELRAIVSNTIDLNAVVVASPGRRTVAREVLNQSRGQLSVHVWGFAGTEELPIRSSFTKNVITSITLSRDSRTCFDEAIE